jgi:LPXTG-site transpeptidase (sortase) family protein
MKLPLFMRIMPVYLVLASIFLLPVYLHHVEAVDATQAGNTAKSKLVDTVPGVRSETIQGKPIRILIPRLIIDDQIVEGRYLFTSTSWSVSKTNANYAVNTPLPNNTSGKTLLYGHWTDQVFGRTKNLAVGDTAYVYTDNGHLLQYAFVSDELVSPLDTSVLHNVAGSPGIILMTCEGSHAQERRLMHFNLVKAV